MKKNKNGFTLVELLAVIVILAIILVIAVPKVMDIINDAKKGTLESTAKMIASQAEKQKVQNTIFGKDDAITCESVAKLNDIDYASCSITFSDDGEAQVTITGSGKFEGLNVCNGTKTNAEATTDECILCEEEIATITDVNYEIKNYDSCVSYLKPIIVEDWGESEEYLQKICKNETLNSYTFTNYIAPLINEGYFTKEELISNDVVSSDSVWEPNITLGNYESCISYMKPKVVDEWGNTEEVLQSLCSGNITWDLTFSQNIQEMVIFGDFIKEELVENNVVGEDSVFININPANQTKCVNYTKEVYVDEWGNSKEELQMLCRGEPLYFKGTDEISAYISFGDFTEQELVENNVIKVNTESKKICVPNYAKDAVTYITNLYNNSYIRNKFGLTKDNTEDENIRYIGERVQNYVSFNNELWRIIGVFNIKTNSSDTTGQQRIKMVRDDILVEMKYDSSSSDVNWSGSDLNNYLNDTTEQGYYYKLSTEAKNQIDGGSWDESSLRYLTDSIVDIYNEDKDASGGIIGLINASDYAFAGASRCTEIGDSLCGISNWLNKDESYWITNDRYTTEPFKCIISDGIISGDFQSNNHGVRPSVYLKSNVKIIDGDGSKDNPYKLKIS